MPKDNLSVREAGNLIGSSGLADDVIHARDEQITQRRGRQREEADDADTGAGRRGRDTRRNRDDADAEDRKPKKKTRREVIAEAEEGDDDYFEDDDATRSNREDGEHEEGDEDELEASDEDPDAEDDDREDDDDADDDAEDDTLYTVKINGKEEKVNLTELRNGYQRNRDYVQKTQAIAQKGRELLGGHQKVAETYTRRLQNLGHVVGGIRQLLVGDVDSAEMQALLARDPQAWQVQRTLMQDRIGKVDAVLNGLNQEHGRHVDELTKTQKAALRATINQERELVVKAIPDWDTKGKNRLGGYLLRSGFTNDELVNTVDSRMLIVADKARKWDAYQASKSKEPKRKFKPTPKSVKTGQGQLQRKGGQRRQNENAFKRDADRAKRTGDMRDAGRAISRLL